MVSYDVCSLFRSVSSDEPIDNEYHQAPVEDTFCFCKRGLIKTLIELTFRINNIWSGFYCDISKLELVLQKNEFPLKLIDKIIKI